jgi:membrane protease YdiL (CAAX protease family)
MNETFESSRAPEQGSALPPNDPFAASLRGFGPIGILAILVILFGCWLFVLLGAILALAWVFLSGTPWRDIGFVRPTSWTRTIIIGIVFGVVFKFTMKAIVMPLFGAPPINQAFHFLAGNAAALPWMLLLVIFGAGFGEETIFRGWMFERFGKLFGQGVVAKILTILISSGSFALAHYSVQGLPGVEQAVITGLSFGTIVAITGRIFMVMIAHAAFDVTALWMIYYDLETRVAHLLYK